MIQPYRLLLAILATAALTGCASLGPGSVTRDRFDYNESLGESWKRQVLMNIVKMRYVEPVSFVEVGQIVAGYSLESDVNLSATFGTIANVTKTSAFTPGLTGKYTDRPTITYTPMTGNAFIRSLMTPLTPENLMSAVQSGVPADLIFKLSVAAINGQRNQTAPIAGFRPAEEKFLRAVKLLRRLQVAGAIRMKTVKDEEKRVNTAVSFWTRGAPPEIASQVRELCVLLGLDPEAAQYRLVYGVTPENNRELALQSFSMMHLLSLLAARVEVPVTDITEGRASAGVREATGGAGEKGGFSVKCSESRPQDAFVSVQYRNRWFWIDDRDMESKRVMSFILLVFTLADTGRREALPQITIPAQ